MYYITSFEELRSQIAERARNRDVIAGRLNDWVANQYGIKDFWAITKEFLGVRDIWGPTLLLCRQIPSIRVEDLACYVLAKAFKFSLLSLPFVDDTFHPENHEKKSYLKIPWVGYVNGRNLLVYERIVTEHMDGLTGKPFSLILTKNGMSTVPAFHFSLRQVVFDHEEHLLDVSDLHRKYARSASKKPDSVYIMESGFARKVSTLNGEIMSDSFLKPPATWYYPLYLSWFLTGEFILLETYENELAQVGKAKKLFEGTVKQIECATGIRPLVLQIPPLDDMMLSMPRKILGNPRLIRSMVPKFVGKTEDSVQLIREIAGIILSSH